MMSQRVQWCWEWAGIPECCPVPKDSSHLLSGAQLQLQHYSKISCATLRSMSQPPPGFPWTPNSPFNSLSLALNPWKRTTPPPHIPSQTGDPSNTLDLSLESKENLGPAVPKVTSCPQAHLWPGCWELPRGPAEAEGAWAGGVVAVAVLGSRCWVSHHEGQLLESALGETQRPEFVLLLLPEKRGRSGRACRGGHLQFIIIRDFIMGWFGQ